MMLNKFNKRLRLLIFEPIFFRSIVYTIEISLLIIFFLNLPDRYCCIQSLTFFFNALKTQHGYDWWGKDAITGVEHPVAANPDGHIQLVCGAISSLIRNKECISFHKPI